MFSLEKSGIAGTESEKEKEGDDKEEKKDEKDGKKDNEREVRNSCKDRTRGFAL